MTALRRIARSPFARDMAWAVLIATLALAHVAIGVDLGIALDGVR